MVERADVQVFKDHFQARIEAALAGTPWGVDLVVAMALQPPPWPQLDPNLAQCLDRLEAARHRLGLGKHRRLSDVEQVACAIVAGGRRFLPSRGLQQGRRDGPLHEGQALFDTLRLARTVAPAARSPIWPPPPAGQAIVPPPSAVTAGGPALVVDTGGNGLLRLRNAPQADDSPGTQVLAHLPQGHPVRALSPRVQDGHMEVQTSLAGALLHGFASNEFLALAPDARPVPVQQPDACPPHTGAVAVHTPRRLGTLTRRVDPAGPLSLSEPGQPDGRHGTDAQALRAELDAIADWLAVDDPAHLRYRPRDGQNFCSVYAHDFCHLAGVYLPRVWWTGPALMALQAGEAPAPLLGDSIAEVSADDLFAWLRDFGLRFGWRRIGTTTVLQRLADQGALGLIAARGGGDGRCGHVAMVVPEADGHHARRNAAGDVIAPLQSQAGSTNVRRGTGRAGWWSAPQFGESAFWIHA